MFYHKEQELQFHEHSDKQKIESMDDDNYKESTEFTSSPEQLFIQQENSQFLREAVESLSKYEQFIFFKSCVETEKDASDVHLIYGLKPMRLL